MAQYEAEAFHQKTLGHLLCLLAEWWPSDKGKRPEFGFVNSFTVSRSILIVI